MRLNWLPQCNHNIFLQIAKEDSIKGDTNQSEASLLCFISVSGNCYIESYSVVSASSATTVTDMQLYTTLFGKQETPWLESCLHLF